MYIFFFLRPIVKRQFDKKIMLFFWNISILKCVSRAVFCVSIYLYLWCKKCSLFCLFFFLAHFFYRCTVLITFITCTVLRCGGVSPEYRWRVRQRCIREKCIFEKSHNIHTRSCAYIVLIFNRWKCIFLCIWCIIVDRVRWVKCYPSAV